MASSTGWGFCDVAVLSRNTSRLPWTVRERIGEVSARLCPNRPSADGGLRVGGLLRDREMQYSRLHGSNSQRA